MEETYYGCLDVKTNAPLHDIQLAYMTAIKKICISGSDYQTLSAMILKINRIYRILSTPNCRKDYNGNIGLRKNDYGAFSTTMTNYNHKFEECFQSFVLDVASDLSEKLLTEKLTIADEDALDAIITSFEELQEAEENIVRMIEYKEYGEENLDELYAFKA